MLSVMYGLSVSIDVVVLFYSFVGSTATIHFATVSHATQFDPENEGNAFFHLEDRAVSYLLTYLRS
jgi:hypothetical protein